MTVRRGGCVACTCDVWSLVPIHAHIVCNGGWPPLYSDPRLEPRSVCKLRTTKAVAPTRGERSPASLGGSRARAAELQESRVVRRICCQSVWPNKLRSIAACSGYESNPPPGASSPGAVRSFPQAQEAEGAKTAVQKGQSFFFSFAYQVQGLAVVGLRIRDPNRNARCLKSFFSNIQSSPPPSPSMLVTRLDAG